MGAVIGDILPFATGVAISPVPIIAVILMLFSARARTNGPVFVAGWIVGLSAVGAIVLVLSGAGGLSDGDGSPAAAGAAKLALGALLLAAAWRQWRARPAPGEPPAMPSWLERVDGFSPLTAAGSGLLLSAVNPKNLALAAAAAVSIGQAGLGTGAQIGALAVFVALASVTVLVPVVYALLGGRSAADRLASARDWLAGNNATVMFVLLLVFGVVLIGGGIEILTD